MRRLRAGRARSEACRRPRATRPSPPRRTQDRALSGTTRWCYRARGLSRPGDRCGALALGAGEGFRAFPGDAAICPDGHGDECSATQHPLVEELHPGGAQPIEAVVVEIGIVRAESFRVEALGIERRAAAELAREPEDLDAAVEATPRLRRAKYRDRG